MKLLAFESSAKAAGVAVLDDGRLLAEYFQNSGQTHSRKKFWIMLPGPSAPAAPADILFPALPMVCPVRCFPRSTNL